MTDLDFESCVWRSTIQSITVFKSDIVSISSNDFFQNSDKKDFFVSNLDIIRGRKMF